MEYYQILRSVRRTEALARHCLIRCRHCRIFFLTHQRNHRTLHLVCCPFGCREERERRESNRRSAAYYREHPDKRRILNERRYRRAPWPVSSVPASREQHENRAASPRKISANYPQDAEDAEAGVGSADGTDAADHDPLPQCPPELAEVLPKAQDPEVIGHVRVMVSLIERRAVRVEEIWQALLKIWRQRTMGRRRKIDHTVAWLNAHPP